MNDADISLIESSLRVSLPEDYKEFLVRHAEEVRRIKTKLPLRAVLWTDSDEIVSENKLARRLSSMMKIGTKPWPKNYLVVGTNGAGDYWFIDVDVSEPGLWFWSHEEENIARHNLTLADYLAELRADAQEPETWVGQFLQ